MESIKIDALIIESTSFEIIIEIFIYQGKGNPISFIQKSTLE